MVFGSLSYPSCLDEICLSFPSFRQGIYNYFSILLKQRDTTETWLWADFYRSWFGCTASSSQAEKIHCFENVNISWKELFSFFFFSFFFLFHVCHLTKRRRLHQWTWTSDLQKLTGVRSVGSVGYCYHQTPPWQHLVICTALSSPLFSVILTATWLWLSYGADIICISRGRNWVAE